MLAALTVSVCASVVPRTVLPKALRVLPVPVRVRLPVKASPNRAVKDELVCQLTAGGGAVCACC